MRSSRLSGSGATRVFKPAHRADISNFEIAKFQVRGFQLRAIESKTIGGFEKFISSFVRQLFCRQRIADSVRRDKRDDSRAMCATEDTSADRSFVLYPARDEGDPS